MQQPSKITEYLETVRQQIRWKKAQLPVLEEINNHIIDQKNAFISEGLSEEEAADRAIAEMGDPVVVGEQLDRAHRPRPDWPLLVMTAAILLLGLAIQVLIGPNHRNNGAEMFQKQFIWAGMAMLVMIAAYLVDFTIIGRFPWVIFFGLCAIIVTNYLFTRVHISSIYAINLLLFFPTAYAGFVYKMRNHGYAGFVLCGVIIMIPAYLAILGRRGLNETVFFLLCTSCLIILTAAVTKGWFNVRKLLALLIMYTSTAAVLPTLFFMTMGEGYVTRRIHVILNPAFDPTGYGYIGTVIQRFLSHAQFIGQGLPLSGFEQYTTLQLLPDVNTDFLLTYLIYRFGWIVLIGIIMILSAFIIRALILCKKQKSVLGFLVSLAIISGFALQCIIYIAANSGLFFFSPLSLPLISYGGQALVINMCLIGLLLSVFRTGDLVGDQAGLAATKSSRFIQFNHGQIIINLKLNK
ncbi:FtsW/RodA/SpoVE family cell cycle protein [Desulfosporosinus nitroreducens]|uniref:FtsW/RodA/SpoVE family cell cycle protein n=2 Tax=Desulfosporosinus nitroreducens TaxID=2018668 RepID=A0ABT8QUX1_9FIRM|nr:FtsW/RodA/SpoVE family cell cycle protein [Desulfosporosinus nitroreducens]MDO0823863.1 FtsW/RodA/SpoVE family cell cycle protein [Desulfosporosinus nitroreducens]